MEPDMADEVNELLDALYAGGKSLDEVAQRFRERTWPRRRRPPPRSYDELAARELEDPDPLVPGSFDDVSIAYHRGRLTDEQYAVLSEAVAAAKRAEDEGRP